MPCYYDASRLCGFQVGPQLLVAMQQAGLVVAVAAAGLSALKMPRPAYGLFPRAPVTSL